MNSFIFLLLIYFPSAQNTTRCFILKHCFHLIHFNSLRWIETRSEPPIVVTSTGSNASHQSNKLHIKFPSLSITCDSGKNSHSLQFLNSPMLLTLRKRTCRHLPFGKSSVSPAAAMPDSGHAHVDETPPLPFFASLYYGPPLLLSSCLFSFLSPLFRENSLVA